jgi:hypothetical protein
MAQAWGFAKVEVANDQRLFDGLEAAMVAAVAGRGLAQWDPQSERTSFRKRNKPL